MEISWTYFQPQQQAVSQGILATNSPAPPVICQSYGSKDVRFSITKGDNVGAIEQSFSFVVTSHGQVIQLQPLRMHAARSVRSAHLRQRSVLRMVPFQSQKLRRLCLQSGLHDRNRPIHVRQVIQSVKPVIRAPYSTGKGFMFRIYF